jgi:hypothetical protein
MALVHIDHVPETVKVNIPLNIILPDPGKMGDVPVAKRKVLYLLHGLSDDASAWQRYSSIETIASVYGLWWSCLRWVAASTLTSPMGRNISPI